MKTGRAVCLHREALVGRARETVLLSERFERLAEPFIGHPTVAVEQAETCIEALTQLVIVRNTESADKLPDGKDVENGNAQLPNLLQ